MPTLVDRDGVFAFTMRFTSPLSSIRVFLFYECVVPSVMRLDSLRL